MLTTLIYLALSAAIVRIRRRWRTVLLTAIRRGMRRGGADRFAGVGEVMKGEFMEGIGYGLSFWAALAMIISWDLNHSIWWAMWHGAFSFLYVIYYAIWL